MDREQIEGLIEDKECEIRNTKQSIEDCKTRAEELLWAYIDAKNAYDANFVVISKHKEGLIKLNDELKDLNDELLRYL